MTSQFHRLFVKVATALHRSYFRHCVYIGFFDVEPSDIIAQVETELIDQKFCKMVSVIAKNSMIGNN